jgi:hypothetical protein
LSPRGVEVELKRRAERVRTEPGKVVEFPGLEAVPDAEAPPAGDEQLQDGRDRAEATEEPSEPAQAETQAENAPPRWRWPSERPTDALTRDLERRWGFRPW